MKLTKSVVICFSMLVGTLIYPQEVLAEGFTNKDFMQFDKVQQKAWIGGIVETLWQVAAQKDKAVAQCISDWYYTDTPKRNGLILSSIKQYPDHTPTTVLMALTERECGKYVRA